ncbi:unnamed protein product [Durusdinium trenchii]|uniref:Uncharacterized protein n=1 Tax=Durusdinium trenchii TaxID=1381693 RepID=A0ABP0L0D2_9DINO
MRKALAARYLEHLTGDDLIDLDELIGADDDEDFISASLQNAIQEISSGGSTAGKQMRALKAHAQDSAQPYGHHSMTKNLLLRCGYFGRDDVSMAIKLSRAFVAFKAWMSANKVECSQPPFTEKMLFKKNSDILLTSKAYNGRVVVQWLSHEVHLASTSPTFSAYDPRFFVIVAALRRMARFLCGLERAGRYLTPEESESIFEDGYAFLKHYKCLTLMSLRLGMQEWFMKPKCHALWHLLVGIRDKRSNPRFFHGFVDEDAMAWIKSTYLKAHPTRAIRWIMRCGKLRIWASHLKIKKFNRHVALRLARKRG